MDTTALAIASAVEKGGIVVTLVLAIFGMAWLYVSERKKSDKLLADLMANNKEMVTVLLGVQAAIEGFKEALNSIKDVICDLDRQKKGK